MAKKIIKKAAKSREKTSPKKKAKKTRAKGQGSKKQGEKLIGNIEHYFGKISVAALKLKSPLSVGDLIHIKGPHTDFLQKVESMQIEHQNVQKAKKGQDVGIKVKEKCRVTDSIYLSAEKQETKEEQKRPLAVKDPKFLTDISNKSTSQQISKPVPKPAPPPPARPEPKKPEKPNPYTGTKFLKF
jgi:hypothetical protein